MEQKPCKLLVADIGGTNSRFAIAHYSRPSKNQARLLHDAGKIVLSNQQQLPSAEFSSLTEVTQAYLASLADQSGLNQACIAVAGPVEHSSVQLTNLNWQSSEAELAKSLQFEQVALMNDFAAYAYSVSQLSAAFLQQIKQGEPDIDAPILVLGPGTGFGVASLVPMLSSASRHFQVVPCEGGHISLAATNEQELVIISMLMHQMGRRVTVEDLLSGPGLLRLYQTMAEVLQRPKKCATPAQISAAALAGNEELAMATLRQFCRLLGCVAGDLALAHGARGGIMLGGGILPRISTFLLKSEFVEAFNNKEHMVNYMNSIPITLVTKSDTALLGAASWYLDQQF